MDLRLHAPLLRLDHVNVYVADEETPLLEGISIGLFSGEWVALVGRSGCGKSVLARTCCGLQAIHSGKIEKSDHPDAGVIPLIMQNPDAQLIGETVFEEIAFGLENAGLPREAIHARTAEALEMIGMSGWGEFPVHRLSGGQKQLLALAGAIALRPAVIVADEATSMLDPDSRQRVMSILKQLSDQGTAILSVTQLLDELAYADRVLALHEGAVCFEGTPREFFYSGDEKEPAWVSRIGLAPPLVVRTVDAMRKRGFQFGRELPLSPEELERAVLQS